MSAWSLDNPVFVNYVFYAGVLAAKVLLMAPATAYYRITKKVFANDEDAKSMGAKEAKLNDPDVERVRRAHQNDLENIPIFWILGLLYTLTDPSPFVAKTIFQVYTFSRIMHTILYLARSGKRGMSYMPGLAIKFFMVYSVISTFMSKGL